MKAIITNILKTIFAICMIYSVFIGAVVAVIFIIGFIANGNIGEQLAISGSTIMNSAIRVAAVGSLVGIIGFYVEGTHELTMDTGKEEEIQDSTSTTA